MAYWLVKSEPEEFSWDQQVKAGKKGTPWTGVRAHPAKLNLSKMAKGDKAFFYHTGDEKQIVGMGLFGQGDALAMAASRDAQRKAEHQRTLGRGHHSPPPSRRNPAPRTVSITGWSNPSSSRWRSTRTRTSITAPRSWRRRAGRAPSWSRRTPGTW